MIYKTFFGKHIDLSKLIEIDDAEPSSKYGSKGSQFTMRFQGDEKNIEYHFTSGDMPALQSKVDEIIKAWEEFKVYEEYQRDYLHKPEKKPTRDEIATAAMQGILSNHPFLNSIIGRAMKEGAPGDSESIVVHASYSFADEMIRRGKQ